MASHKTENLELNSWERTDLFNMDEFNENFSKLDQAVGENSGKIDQAVTDTNSKIDQGLANVNSKLDQGLTETNSKIDQGLADANTALAAKADKTALQTLDTRVTTVQGTIPKVASGSYIGTGNYSAPTTITLGFKPKGVVINRKNTSFGSNSALILENVPVMNGSTAIGQITANGFTTIHLTSPPYLNESNVTYCYLAVG